MRFVGGSSKQKRVTQNAASLVIQKILELTKTERQLRRFARTAKKISWGQEGLSFAHEAVASVVIGKTKPQPVYDLTVEDLPEFFANGVLVHNSSGGFNRLVFRRPDGEMLMERQNHEVNSSASRILELQARLTRRGKIR